MLEKQMQNLAWNTFKQTGNINTFMELLKMESIGINQNNMENNEKQVGKIEEIKYGNYKD